MRALAPSGDDPRRPDADVGKLARYDDRYRLRGGDYRIIYGVMDGQLVILVVEVGHGRETYRAMSRQGLPTPAIIANWKPGLFPLGFPA